MFQEIIWVLHPTTTKTQNCNASLIFGNDQSIICYHIYGSEKEVVPFKYAPNRNTGYQFMSINNGIVISVFVYNNNVISGGKACFFM